MDKHNSDIEALAHIGRWQTNLSTGERFWSDEIYRIIGLEPDCIMPSVDSFYDIVHPDDIERVQKNAEWAEQVGHKDIIYRILRPDGTIRHLHDQAKADTDSQGRLIMLSGTVQDITDRVEIENRLRESEERFTFAATSAGDGIWDWNINTGHVDFSRLFEKMLGYGKGELPPHIDSWLNNIHPDDFARTRRYMRNYLRGDLTEYSAELRMRCKDGSYKWILCRGTVTSRDTNGEALRMTGLHSDITEQKNIKRELALAREQAENAHQARIEFLNRLSRQISPSINSIRAFGQHLKAGEGSLQENAEAIVKAGTHLLELVDEMLDQVKIEAGQIDLSPEPTLLSDVIAETLQAVTPLARRRGIEIILAHNGRDITFEQLVNKHHILCADQIRLGQVLYNLLDNAVKYNRENGELIINCDDSKSNLIRISISDTGPGIPPERQELLFKPRTGPSATEDAGMGLLIAKNLIELMGGALGLNSQPDVGSCFWIDLTVKPNTR